MDTKKFKINTTEKVNGGKKVNVKSVFSKAGFTVGGAAAGAAFATMAAKRKPDPEEPQTPDDSTTVEDLQETVLEPQPQQTVQHAEAATEDVTEPQPIDSHQTNGDTAQNEDENEDIDPRDVAESIAQEVDDNDIDADNIITLDGFDYAYMPDGTQQLIAIGHTPDGIQYALVDLDGDGMYGDVFDLEGNYVAEVPGLSISDLADMVDDTGGYLAGVPEPWGDESATEIDGKDNLYAEAEEVDEDDLDEELLAQLIDEVDEKERLIDDDENLEDEDDDSELEEDDYSDDDE